jgi:hypothetical protein
MEILALRKENLLKFRKVKINLIGVSNSKKNDLEY